MIENKIINEDVLYNIFSFVNKEQISNYDYSKIFHQTPFYKTQIRNRYVNENAEKIIRSFFQLQNYYYHYTHIDISKASSVYEIYDFLALYYGFEIDYIREKLISKDELFINLKLFSENIEDQIIYGEKNREISRYKKELQEIMKKMI